MRAMILNDGDFIGLDGVTFPIEVEAELFPETALEFESIKVASDELNEHGADMAKGVYIFTNAHQPEWSMK
jgi:hypothetical protein